MLKHEVIIGSIGCECDCISGWTEALSAHRTAPIVFFANEFFDALPVHQFVKTKDGWSEILVDIDEQGGCVHLHLLRLQPACTLYNMACAHCPGQATLVP